MRTVHPPAADHPAADDGEAWPPGKLQIRDAALALFAEHGPDAVSMRDIAAAADVSLGLLVHHFGTKERLRRAVDDHVAGVFDGMIASLVDDPTALVDAAEGMPGGIAEVMLRHLPPNSPMPAYLRRLMLSGDGAGHVLFRRWFDLTVTAMGTFESAGVVRASDDPAARAAFLLVNDLAVLLLRWHLAAVLDGDPLAPEGVRRWSAAVADVYLHGVLPADDGPTTKE